MANPKQAALCVQHELSQGNDVVVAVSARQGVTKDLRTLMLQQTREVDGTKIPLDFFEEVHAALIDSLDLGTQHDRNLRDYLALKCHELSEFRDCASKLPEMYPGFLDQVLPLGEEMSWEIMATVLRAMGVQVQAVDSQDIFRVDRRYGRARFLWPQTVELMGRAWRKKPVGATWVIPGFYGGTVIRHRVVKATVCRNGTDRITAAVGRVLKPILNDEVVVVIYKDVAGVMTGDPRLIPDARVLSRVLYQEAEAANVHGADVVESGAVSICRESGIPIEVRDYMRPELDQPGTLIADFQKESLPGPVRILTHRNNTTIVSVLGSFMQGVTGTRVRIANAFAKADASIIMDGQGSDERGIDSVVDTDVAEEVVRALEEEFRHEVRAGEITIESVPGMPVVAAVSGIMRGSCGTLARLAQAVADEGVSIETFIQTRMQENMSFCVPEAKVVPVLRSIHAKFQMDTLG